MGTPVAAKGNRGFLITRRHGGACTKAANDSCKVVGRIRFPSSPLKRQAREACQQIDKSDNPLFARTQKWVWENKNNLGH